MASLKAAILADDLTSALDGAAGFASRGDRTRVQLNQHSTSPIADIVSIDLDSRFDGSDRAFAKARRAACQVAEAPIIYKTIDSTLRGNLLAETRGAVAGSGRKRVIIAPAFPDGGRVTRDGRQWVDGVPVSESSYARDIRTPVVTDRIDICFAGLDADITIVDAETNADLDTIVSAHVRDPSVLWVGSPGIAAALARSSKPADRHVQISLHATRVLVVVGSLHEVNSGQIDALTEQGAQKFRIDQNALLTDALATDFSATSPIAVLVTNRSIEAGTSPEDVAIKAAEIVARARRHFDGLIVSGGDTARRIVDRLGGMDIELSGETEPGVPVGILTAGVRMPFITKAGGFGSRQTLANAANHLLARKDIK